MRPSLVVGEKHWTKRFKRLGRLSQLNGSALIGTAFAVV
jgi:hypothetical protein